MRAVPLRSQDLKNNMKPKNPHLQRHILKTETYQELANSRIHKHTRKKLNSKLGGLAKGMKLKSDESTNS
jgi:hypothetical protein